MSYTVSVRIITLSLLAFFDSDRFRVLLPSRRNNICTISSPFAESMVSPQMRILYDSMINCVKDYANRP
jgi:hypothetical protein